MVNPSLLLMNSTTNRAARCSQPCFVLDVKNGLHAALLCTHKVPRTVRLARASIRHADRQRRTKLKWEA